MSNHLFDLLVAVTPATIAAIAATINSRINSAQIQKTRAEVREIQVTINGRMAELLALTQAAAASQATAAAAAAVVAATPKIAAAVLPAIMASTPDQSAPKGETK